MANQEVVIPLASRLVPFEKRDNNEKIVTLLNEIDRAFVNNVCQGLYMDSFDVYLGGELARKILPETIFSYSAIDIVAIASIESTRQNFMSYLQHTQEQTGSDAWVHFGMTVQRQVGFSIHDTYLGSWFYARELASSHTNAEFELVPAIYESQEREPSPIHLHLAPSLAPYRVIW